MGIDDHAELKTKEVESRIIEFLQLELLSPGETVNRDDDLLSGEIIDSIAVLRLASFAEEEFKIDIQPSDFVIENFQNVAVLARYILRANSGT
jgi:acyl carrier protein